MNHSADDWLLDMLETEGTTDLFPNVPQMFPKSETLEPACLLDVPHVPHVPQENADPEKNRNGEQVLIVFWVGQSTWPGEVDRFADADRWAFTDLEHATRFDSFEACNDYCESRGLYQPVQLTEWAKAEADNLITRMKGKPQ